MLYILDQRLRAQSIPGEKARKGERRAAGAGPAPGAARRGVPRPVRAVRGLSLRPLPGWVRGRGPAERRDVAGDGGVAPGDGRSGTATAAVPVPVPPGPPLLPPSLVGSFQSPVGFSAPAKRRAPHACGAGSPNGVQE